MAPQNLTEYERKRLENIRRNDQMVAALKLHSKASELSAASKRQRVVTKSYKVSPEKKTKTETPVVIRRSLRTRGIPPDPTKVVDEDLVESAANKTKQPVNESQYHFVRDLGPVSMSDVYRGTGSYQTLVEEILSMREKSQLGKNDGVLSNLVKKDCEEDRGSLKLESVDNCANSIEKECKEGSSSVIVKNERMQVEDLKLTRDRVSGNLFKSENEGIADCKKLETEGSERSCLKLSSLDLKLENIARVVSGRILVVRFFPCSHRRMIMAGNKFGDLGFWNVDTEGDEENAGIYLYRPHPAPISGILVHQYSSSKVFTCCYDGFIRVMDTEKEVFNLVHHSDETIYSLSQQPNSATCLYFGEGHGGLNIWDEREGKCSTSWNLHEDRINSIDFNPKNPNIMATCSSDGTACIWDLRSISYQKPKSLNVIDHERAVHSAYFSPSGSFLATTSFDNTIGITSGCNFDDTISIHHNNFTGRWISSFRGIWGWDDSYIFVGNMKRAVDVISPVERRVVYTLQSQHMSAIPCRFDAHPYNIGTLAGATSGGQVYMWTPI